MSKLRFVLGLLEIGAALKFLSNADIIWGWGLLSRETMLLLWVLLAVACACALAGKWDSVQPPPEATWRGRIATWLRTRLAPEKSVSVGRKIMRWLPSAAFLAIAAYFAWGIGGRDLDAYTESYVPPRQVCGFTIKALVDCEQAVAELPWTHSLDQALLMSQQTGKPIFVDFRGFTCVNCRWMERKIISRGPVLEVLRAKFILVMLYTDGGPDADKNLKLEVERFRTLALPYYVLLSPNDAVLAIHAGILPSVSGFLEFLGQATRAG